MKTLKNICTCRYHSYRLPQGHRQGLYGKKATRKQKSMPKTRQNSQQTGMCENP